MWVALISLALYTRSHSLFIITAVAGTLTKEVLAIAALPWLIMTVREFVATKKIRSAIFGTIAAASPIAAFLGVRAAFGTSPVEVNFGFDPLAGEFPTYWERFTTMTGIVTFVLAVFFAWTVLWVGMSGVSRPVWLRDWSWSLFLGLVISIALLSGRVTRTMAPMGPLLALGVMPLLQKLDRKQAASSPDHNSTSEAPTETRPA
jgi:hypothetical protein